MLTAATISQYTDQLIIAGHSTRTIRGYLRYLARFDAECGAMNADRVQVVHWLANPAWSPATRKAARTALRSWYRWAVETGVCRDDPTSALPRIKVPKTLPRPAPDDVWAAAWAKASGWQERMMLLLACHAGLRRSEIAAVSKRDLDQHGLRVMGKGDRMRVVPLSPDLSAQVAMWPAGLVWLCPGRFGGHAEASFVGKRLSRLLGPGWSGHTLRHRAATMTYSASSDLAAVQDLLGHASPETTRVYVRVCAEHLAAAVTAGSRLSPVT